MQNQYLGVIIMFKNMLNTLHQQGKQSESGQGLVEYALLLMLVGAISIGGLRLLGVGIQGVYTEINCEIQTDTCGNRVASADVDDSSGDDSGDDGSGDGDDDDGGDDDSEEEEEEEEEEPCSTTDVPVLELQCIGGSVYVTITSTCETVDSANLSLATDNILDLPLDITLAKEPSGLTLSTEPILGVAICLAVDTNTLSVDGTVYYNDGEVATVGVN